MGMQPTAMERHSKWDQLCVETDQQSQGKQVSGSEDVGSWYTGFGVDLTLCEGIYRKSNHRHNTGLKGFVT